MNGFKRFCLIVFGLAGLLVLAAYLLPMFGYYKAEIDAVVSSPIGGRAVFYMSCVTALGCLISLLRGILSPRNRRSVIISSEGGDEIQVTRDAIKAQAVHVIEQDGNLVARNVTVNAKKRGHIRVFARVQPENPVNVVEEGARLHDELARGLADICGDKVDRVNLEFIDPVTHDRPQSFDDLEASYAAARTSVPAASVPTVEEHGTEGITVPMGTSSWHPTEVTDTTYAVPEPTVAFEPDAEPVPAPEAAPAVGDGSDGAATDAPAEGEVR